MLNPQYEGDFAAQPSPERWCAMKDFVAIATFSAGVKTITHDRHGLKIIPHQVVVIEMKGDDTMASFEFSAEQARILAGKLAEFADAIDPETRTFSQIKQEIKNGPSV